MPSNLVFNDGAAATLDNGRGPPFDRFWVWTPSRVRIEHTSVILGTGDEDSFLFRKDFIVSLELRDIPESKVQIALRLIDHLLGGGQATLNAGDPAANSYTVKRRPRTIPTLTVQDERKSRYVFHAELKNVAAADLLCFYA